MLFVEQLAMMIFGLFDSTALQVFHNQQLTSLPPLTMFRFLEFLDVRDRAPCAPRRPARRNGRAPLIARSLAQGRLLRFATVAGGPGECHHTAHVDGL